jgi:hypothetical protein
MKLHEVVAKVEEMEKRLQVLEDALKKSQERRGPKSEREMTDDDARKILVGGEFASKSHKDAAEALGLSYAQVYSCRKEFTFKHIHKELRDAQKAQNP